MTDVVPRARATARDRLGVVVLALPALLTSMDLSVLFLASPWISADLGPTSGQLLWAMDIYGFMMAGLLITMGTVGDRIGRRKLLLIGAVAFGAASLLAAFATGAEMLIIARALLGVGGATLAPSTLSLIRGMFDDEDQRRTAVGVWTGAFLGGVTVGPIVGGLLLEHFWWGSVFLINVPVIAVLLIAAPIVVDESRDPDPGRFDVLDAALSLGAVLPTVHGVKAIAEDGVRWTSVTGIALGAGLAAVFVARQLRSASPMIDVRLFARPAFSAAVLSNGVIVFASAGMGLLAATYIQTVLGHAPFVAALWMLPTVAGTVVGVAIASRAARTVSSTLLVPLGLLIAASGFVVFCLVTPDSHIGVLITAYSALTLGVGVTATLVTSLVLAAAPPEKAGAASALAEATGEFGGALGIAVLGTLAGTIYRNRTDTDTLGHAVAAARDLPDEAADLLLERAFDAYTSGFTAAAVVGAVLLTASAVAAGPLLRAGETPRSTGTRRQPQ